MGRSRMIVTVVAILACTAPGWGQVLQGERFITVKENGKDAVQCKVLKCWKEKDGSQVCQVQSLVTGEKFTIVDGSAMPTSSTPPRQRIFSWGRNNTSPPGAPLPPTTTEVVVKEVTVSGTPATTTPVTTTGKQVITSGSERPRPGLFGNVFTRSVTTREKVTEPPLAPGSSGVVPVTTGTTPTGTTPTSTTSPKSLPLGSTTTSGTTRSSLPLSMQPRSADPIDRPDLYTAAPVAATSTTPLSPNSLPAALTSGSSGVTPVSATEGTTSVTTATTPPVLKPTPSILPPPATKGSAPTVTSTTDCKACATGKPCTTCTTGKCQPCATCTTGTCTTGTCTTCGTTQPQRYGLLSRLRSGNTPSETVVVKESSPLVSVPSRGLLGRKDGVVIETTQTVKSVRTPTIREERVVVSSSLPRNEGRIGAFSGMRTSRPKVTTSERRGGRSDLPAGMSSVEAAGSPGVAEDTPVAAIVRTPDGQTRMMPYNQVASNMPAVPVNAPNAFSLSTPGVSMYTVNPDQVANAFGMAMPTRPVPADYALSANVPNAFNGMGGMPGDPRQQVAQGYPVAMHYPTAAVGYYPAMPGYYAPQPMVHPGAVMPAGRAVASDYGSATSHYLAALRLSLMPSERERAVEALSRVNWKADPQVVPALVMAAQTDPAATVRVSCIRALGHMKAGTTPTVEALQQLKEDKDPRVRQEVQQVLYVLTKQ